MRQLRKIGMSPPIMAPGGGLLMTLADWGLAPQPNLLPLQAFNSVWRVEEPRGLETVHVRQVAMDDAFR